MIATSPHRAPRARRGGCHHPHVSIAVPVAWGMMVIGGCGKKDTLRTLERVPLPDTVAAAATLALDSAGRAWVGERGRLTAFDSAGRVVARLPVALKGTPRLLGIDSGRVYLRTDSAAA